MLTLLLGAVPALAATNLIANGTFEGKKGAGTLSGWSATGGTLSLVAGNGGGHAAQVTVKPGTKKVYGATRPVKAGTVAGTAYTLDGQVQSSLAGQAVCLLIKEITPATNAMVSGGTSQTCLTPTTAWQQFPQVGYVAKAAGDTLAINVIESRAPAGATFSFDNIVLAVAADTTLPSVPQSVSANATSPTSVDVSWQASQDNVGVAGYDVYRDGTLMITLPGNATTWTDNSAQPATPYSYTVDAYDAAGNHSAQSQPGVTTTPPPPDTTLPSVPQSVSANATSPTSIDVSWQASQDNVGVTGYDVYRDGTLVNTLPGGTTMWTDNSAQPATSYSYTVDAFDAAGNHSAQSDPATATTPSSGGPGNGICGGLQRPASGAPYYSHIVVIMEENKDYTAWLNSPSFPYTNQLAGQCGSAAHMLAVTHPSQVNYVAMATGTQPAFNVRVSSDNVFHQMGAAGHTWLGLEESMPNNCQGTTSGFYKSGHNPAYYLTNLGPTGDGSCARNNIGFSATFAPSRLADYTFVVPNVCNDMHWQSGCSGTSGGQIATAEAWLQQFLTPIFTSADYQAGNTLVLITFDEGVETGAPQGTVCITQANPDAAGCHIPTIAMSQYITPGTVDQTAYSLYSILASIENNFGLPLLGNAATQSPLGPGMGF